MSDTKIPIPERASGRLVYIGTDQVDDIQGALATLGAVLHFAADNLEQFTRENNDHHTRHHGPDVDPEPTTAEYRAAIVFAHDLVSPGCAEQLP